MKRPGLVREVLSPSKKGRVEAAGLNPPRGRDHSTKKGWNQKKIKRKGKTKRKTFAIQRESSAPVNTKRTSKHRRGRLRPSDLLKVGISVFLRGHQPEQSKTAGF